MKNVMVVDDESIISLDLKERLVDMGYCVPARATTGEEAVRLAADFKPDVIIMDIVMPGTIDGIEAAKIIREKHGIPVIFLTAFSENKYIERAKEVLPYGFILKPFHMEELRAVLEITKQKLEVERELRNAQQELARSENEYRSLVENLNEGIWKLDSEAKIIFVNSKMAEILGYPRHEMIGKKVSDFLLTHSIPSFNELWERRKQGYGENHNFEFVKRSGDKIIVHMCCSPEFGSDGEFSGILASVIDVTSHKQSESEIRRRAKLEMLVAEISASLMLFERNSPDIAINNALRKLGEFEGVDRSYIFLYENGTTIAGNTHEWCAPGIEPQIGNLQGINMKTGLPWIHSHFVRFNPVVIDDVERLGDDAKTEREHLQVQGVKSLIAIPLIHSGRLEGFLGFDFMTQKKILNEELLSGLRIIGDIIMNSIHMERERETLRESESRYRILFENSPLPNIMIDRETLEIVDANQAAIDMFGYARDEFIGLHPEIISEKPEQGGALLEARPRIIFGFESTFRKKDGSQFPAKIYANLISVNRKDYYITQIRDLQASREAEKLHLRLVEKEKYAAVGRVAGKMAHDFNNIIGVVMGAGGMLNMMEDLSEEARKYIDMIVESGKRGKSVTQNLLLLRKTRNQSSVTLTLTTR